MTVKPLDDNRGRRLDDAARAAWLYFVAGNTQDEIAVKLELSRQAVQRLVALAVAERLIRFRLDHPIAACMELSTRLRDKLGLDLCEVVPSDPAARGAIAGIATATAVRIERLLAGATPLVLGVGTGRTMRAAVESMEGANQPRHKIISLVGNMAADGHASPYDVVMRLADRIGAQRFPLPAPVLAETVADRVALQAQRAFAVLRGLREQARACFVGVSEVAWNAPMHQDGFMSDEDVASLIGDGAVGEITGWSFDAGGRVLAGPVNARVASLPLEQPPLRLTIVIGCGARKVPALTAVFAGRLANGLITDEATAKVLLGH